MNSSQPRDSKLCTIEGEHKRENIVAPPVRTARANNETRELILRTALPVFAQKGFDGATTREIATAADVNHGLIPYYFGTKGKLWEECVDFAFGNMAVGPVCDDSSTSMLSRFIARSLRSLRVGRSTWGCRRCISSTFWWVLTV